MVLQAVEEYLLREEVGGSEVSLIFPPRMTPDI